MYSQTFKVRGGWVPKSMKPRAEAEAEAGAAVAAEGEVDADGASTTSSKSNKNVIKIEVPITQPVKKTKRRAPQETIDEFWTKFNSKTPGQATSVLPKNALARKASENVSKGHKVENAAVSYEQAAQACKDKVAQIVRECRRVNQKYRDPHFDIEFDLKRGPMDCLRGLGAEGNDGDVGLYPKSVKRVTDIFENPQFYVGGADAGDVRQGRDGDCWFMAALCTLSNQEGLLEKVCVARDEQVGVYGFVFHRDGEWRSEIIDDKLYLTQPDYDESWFERNLVDDVQMNRARINSEEEYKKIFQTNSGALYFAQCEDPNETWLPLLEKAYAKAHGDYSAIQGGFTGEALEDLTGGVTTELFSSDILDKEKFWKEEVLKVNKEFLFGCYAGIFAGRGERKGIYECHAYSIMKAVEIDGKRLCLLRNPWGEGEWNGPWSDGSKEWTPEWMQKLDHRFGDDGAFWISYEDLLKKYQVFDRTRVFADDWRVTQQWASLTIPWNVDYHDTKFSFTLEQAAPVVIVLSQLDDRYFCGLEGQYRFELSFRVHKEGEADYLTRSHGNYWMRRSVTAELPLEPGEYSVLVRIIATKYGGPTVEKMVRDNARERPDKLMRIGLSYDLAHAKGQLKETPEEKKERKKAEEEAKKKEKKEMKEKLMKDKQKAKHNDNRQKRRDRAEKEKRKLKEKAKKAKKAEKEKAKKEKAEQEQAEKDKAEKEKAEKESAEAPKTEETKATEEKKEGPATETPAATETKAEEPTSAAEEPKPTEPATEPVSKKETEKTPALAEETKAEDSTTSETKESKPTPVVEEEKAEVEEPKPAEPSTSEAVTEKKESEEAAAPADATPTEEKATGEAPSTEAKVETDVAEGEKTTEFPDPAAAPPDVDGEEEEGDSDSDDDSDINSICSDLSSTYVEDAVAEAKATAEANYVAPPEEELDEFEQDPWNAVAVVGLRIYSKDAAVAVKVVRPRNRTKEEKDTPAEGKLDVDDSAADALKNDKVEGEGKEEAANSESGTSQKSEESNGSSVVVV